MITAQVVLINKDGLVLGVSRKTDHNDMGLPGGKMDPEDDGNPLNTAIRETLEETGLRISNLKLVFAIHKSGNMGYTYMADFEGEINHNEPHVVKWVPFEVLVAGSFGRYNQLVSESLDSMGVKYQFTIDTKAVLKEIKDYVNTTPYNGIQFKCGHLKVESNLLSKVRGIQVSFVGKFDDLDESLGLDDKFDKGLDEIGERHGFNIYLNSDYIGK